MYVQFDYVTASYREYLMWSPARILDRGVCDVIYCSGLRLLLHGSVSDQPIPNLKVRNIQRSRVGGREGEHPVSESRHLQNAVKRSLAGERVVLSSTFAACVT